MNKPEIVETTFTFTYSELQTLLWTFGTSVGVGVQSLERSHVTYHTDAVVIPAVSKQLKNT